MHKKQKKGLEDYSLSTSFHQQLCLLPVTTLKTKNNHIYICQRDNKVIEVWKGLAKQNFHSLPVMQKTHKGRLYAMLDLHDICRYVVDTFGEKDLKELKDFWKFVEESEKMKNVKVNDIVEYPLSHKNPYHPVNEKYSLYFALELFAREKELHRIPVINEKRELVNMLTQSRIIEFFKLNKNILGNRIQKPVSLLSSSSSGVFKVTEKQKAIEAFKLMKEKRISAVPVVKENGQISGVISETDLKTISTDGTLFYKLFMSCEYFVNDINNQYKEKNKKEKKLIIVEQTKGNVGQVIDLLHENKIHRVFIVNNKKEPVGVVSIKDILTDVICH